MAILQIEKAEEILIKNLEILIPGQKKQILKAMEEYANHISSQLEPPVMQKTTVIWVTYDEFGELEKEFIYPEEKENEMPYQCEKYLMFNKNKTAKRLSCFSA